MDSDIQATFDIATHNGCITITNPNSKKDRNWETFRIRTQKADVKFAPGQRIVSVMRGPSNDDKGDWMGFGFVTDRGINVWYKKRGSDQHFETYANMLMNPKEWQEQRGLVYKYEGRCRKCNRRLTVPESIDSGIGPVCGARINAAVSVA